MCITDSVRLKFLVPLLLGAAVFVLWRFVYPCALAYHEQMQLFLWSSDYAVARIGEPGGVARYIAEFISTVLQQFSRRGTSSCIALCRNPAVVLQDSLPFC